MLLSLPAVCHTAAWLLKEFVPRFRNLLDCSTQLDYEIRHLYMEQRSYEISILVDINPSGLSLHRCWGMSRCINTKVRQSLLALKFQVSYLSCPAPEVILCT